LKVALGVTGCIAAYKAIEVMRGLQKEGVSVQVVLTRSATRFVAPLTFEALSSQDVITDMFGMGINRRIEHIRLAQAIQLLAVVPATANIIGKFAHGIADDFLSTLYLSCPAPVVLAPAMNVEMWHHPAVRANIDILKARGNYLVNPESGALACGMEGEGRLATVESIVSLILEILRPGLSLAGLKILVTAGPTVEDIDPVRFISNRSSGKMGYAVAQAASRRGAEVYLVTGPTNIDLPPAANVIPVRSAAEMKNAVLAHYPAMDIVVKAAAVSDYRPSGIAQHKLKKSDQETVLSLSPTEDILATLGKEKAGQVLIGFAAETEDILVNARGKLSRKNLDIVVANDVSSGVFGADSATVHLMTAAGESVQVRDESKLRIADRILDMALTVRESRKQAATRKGTKEAEQGSGCAQGRDCQ
jgi:phosphopantothenoylcysteine decarboxylase / phosphopantothenate---cysteine ligase